jgi:glucose dehydrogenase
VTYGIGNPYQSPATAMAHPSAQLYTDSDVNLNAATGKLRWHYQGVTNDFEDHDMQTSPISTRINGKSVVIGSGKMGIVYEMNAHTGKLLWKTSVGDHNGHENASLLMLEHQLTIKAPYTILPGSIGGVLSNLAVAGHSIYVATINLPMTYTTMKLPVAVKSAGPITGQIESLSLATGKVQWDTKLTQMPLGAATIANNLVFTTLYNGQLTALDRRTGAVVYHRQLPTSTNSPIAIAGNTVIIPAGGPKTRRGGGGDPQVVAYTTR